MKLPKLTDAIGRFSIARERRNQIRRTKHQRLSSAAKAEIHNEGFLISQVFQAQVPTALVVVVDGNVISRLPANLTDRSPKDSTASAYIDKWSLKEIYAAALEVVPEGNRAPSVNDTDQLPTEFPQVTLGIAWAFDNGTATLPNRQLAGLIIDDCLVSTSQIAVALAKIPGASPEHYQASSWSGRAEKVTISNPNRMETEFGSAEVRGNRAGRFILILGTPEPARVSSFADAVVVTGSTIHVTGRMTALTGAVDEARVIWRSNTANKVFDGPCDLTLDQTWTQHDTGRKTFTYSSSVDFDPSQWGELLTSDQYDAYMLTRDAYSGQYHEQRLARVPFLARLFHTSDTLTLTSGQLSIVPYFTFRAKALSARIECFREPIEKYLNPSRAIVRRVRASRPTSRPIWLIGEQPYKAQDNGMHFYNWLRKKHRNIDAYYVINSDSPDRKNLIDAEHIITPGSKQHFVLALQAERFVGTHHPDYLYPTRNPKYVKKLRGSRIFLQHGVMAMKWIVPLYGRKQPGFETEKFIVSSEYEKSYIVSDYGYDDSEVAVTGLARFDALFGNDTKPKPNSLLIMPTWREWLQVSGNFTETEYYCKWHGLLSSKDFQDVLSNYQISATLCLHPNMQRFSSHFADTPVNVVYQGEEDVQSLMMRHACMITDYSSVGFDFSFQNRPVIYFQFDRDRLLGKARSHIDMDAELPGLVCVDSDEVLRSIETLAVENFAQPKELHSKSSRFIDYRDTNNNQRTYETVLATDSPARHYRRARVVEARQVAYRWFRRNNIYLPTMKLLFKFGSVLPRWKGLTVFESHNGRQYSDSPRSIYEQQIKISPDSKKVWVLNQRHRFTDTNTSIVERMTPSYFWYLSRAETWVFNQSAPHYLKRPRRTNFIQTWHGTPLKKMQHDAIQTFGRADGYLERAKRATSQWSTLLSPSPYATSAFRSAFRYSGNVAELGYPRNDTLVRDNNSATINAIKRKLSIPPETKLVLYAPTFRDDQFSANGKFDFALPFTLENFQESAPSDSILLLRLHSQVSRKLEIPSSLRDRIRDVSSYSEIQELLLISTVVITDYSSVFFDAAILNRPIIFYAYDLDHYKNRLRGFYLDYEQEVPGPVITSENELWSTVNETLLNPIVDKKLRQEFNDKFNPFEDGLAAERVVRALMSPEG